MLALIAGCALAGCSNDVKLVPVEGIVSMQGGPVADAAVMFHPTAGGPVASGVTDAAGHFALQTINRPGAIPGGYRVTVAKQITKGIEPSGSIAPGGLQIEWITPERYSRPETSGLTAELTSGNKQLAFELATP
jgi:hypothetical protein